MATYEILITDVTNYGALYCVAGLSADGTMIRPEPPGANANWEASRFWTGADAGPNQIFAVGNVVSFEANSPPGDFPYPHATEDRVVIQGCARQVLETVAYSDIRERAAPSVSLSLNDAFDGALVLAPSGKPHVLKDNHGRSLGAIEISTEDLEFHVNDYNPDKPKLRARLSENNTIFDLPVTADDINSGWKAHGLQTLANALEDHSRAHLRLGLSRPFAAQPVNCYAQINGIFLFDD